MTEGASAEDLLLSAQLVLDGISQGAGLISAGLDWMQGDTTSALMGVTGMVPGAFAAQHGYEVFTKGDRANVVDTGVSGGKVTKGGKSYRANSKLSKMNKSEPGVYDAEIVKTLPAVPRRSERYSRMGNRECRQTSRHIA